jgi:hypothetical protein
MSPSPGSVGFLRPGVSALGFVVLSRSFCPGGPQMQAASRRGAAWLIRNLRICSVQDWFICITAGIDVFRHVFAGCCSPGLRSQQLPLATSARRPACLPPKQRKDRSFTSRPFCPETGGPRHATWVINARHNCRWRFADVRGYDVSIPQPRRVAGTPPNRTARC